MPGNALSSVFIPKFMAGLKSGGYEPKEVLRECRLDPELLENPNLTIDFWEFSRLSKRIIKLLKDETHGLLEVPQSIGTSELIALVLIQKATLEEAIDSLALFSNRRQSGMLHSVQKTLTNCLYRVDIEADCRMLNEFAVEAALLFRHRLLCWLCGVRIPVTQLHLPYAAPEWQHEYQYMYTSAAVFFESPYAGFTFDKSYLGYPIVQDEAGVNDQLAMAFGALPQVEFRLGPLATQVRDRVLGQLTKSGEIPNLESTAKALSFEPHTLRRRLKKEGISYHELLAIARQDLAVKLLAQKTMSIEDVASNLGYTEMSSFSRAFKTWTGMTPMEYRQGT